MTSRLEKYLSNELYTRFGQYSIRQNYRPDWLNGLELDFYIDELKLAAEVQGQQHYSFVKFFHQTEEDFKKQQKRDEEKSLICFQNGITLKEIFTEKDADLFILFIKEKLNQAKLVMPELIKINKHNKSQKGAIKGYNKCLKNIFLYENGLLDAEESTVKKWRALVLKGVTINGIRYRE